MEKVVRGPYRVPQPPTTQYDSFAQAVLWTGFPATCLSHDSALNAWEISDINPDKIHLTVAARRRITRQNQQSYAIHHQDPTSEPGTRLGGNPTVEMTLRFGPP